MEPQGTSTPPPLHREAPKPDVADWMKQRAFGLGALALGTIAFIVAVAVQGAFWGTPDWRLTVPFFVPTLGLAVVSLVRRERPLALAMLGLGFAAAAMVLGWFLITAIVVGVTGLIILILSTVL